MAGSVALRAMALRCAASSVRFVSVFGLHLGPLRDHVFAMVRHAPILLALFVTFAGAILPSKAQAGPWVPEAGHGYAKLWFRGLAGFGLHGGGEETLDYGGYTEIFVSSYGEVGLGHNLAVVWQSDLFRVFLLEDPRDYSRSVHVAPGDPRLGLRWNFLDTEAVLLAIEAGVRAPIASGNVQEQVREEQEPHAPIGGLLMGSGVWEADAQLSLGHAFDNAYLAVSGGYQFRASGFADRIVWSVEGGATLQEVWNGRMRLVGAHSIGTRDNVITSPSGMGDGASYLGLIFEVENQLTEHFDLGASLQTALYARHLSSGFLATLYGAVRF